MSNAPKTMSNEEMFEAVGTADPLWVAVEQQKDHVAFFGIGDDFEEHWHRVGAVWHRTFWWCAREDSEPEEPEPEEPELEADDPKQSAIRRPLRYRQTHHTKPRRPARGHKIHELFQLEGD